MKKRLLPLLAVLSLFVAAAAVAGTGLWTKPTSCAPFPCVTAFYGTGTGSAPNDLQPDGGVIGNNVNADGGVLARTAGLGPQSGIALSGMRGFSVTVTMATVTGLDAGGTFTAGTLQAYFYDPVAARWSRANDFDLTVAAGLASQSFPGFTVTAHLGRIAYVPNGIGQAVNVVIIGAL